MKEKKRKKTISLQGSMSGGEFRRHGVREKKKKGEGVGSGRLQKVVKSPVPEGKKKGGTLSKPLRGREKGHDR